MKLQPVRKRTFRVQQYIRSLKYWFFSLVGIGASILTLTGCNGRRRLMGVQPYFEEHQDTTIVDYHLGGEAPVVDTYPLAGVPPLDDTIPLHRDTTSVDTIQCIPVDTIEVMPFNHLPGDIAPVE